MYHNYSNTIIVLSTIALVGCGSQKQVSDAGNSGPGSQKSAENFAEVTPPKYFMVVKDASGNIVEQRSSDLMPQTENGTLTPKALAMQSTFVAPMRNNEFQAQQSIAQSPQQADVKPTKSSYQPPQQADVKPTKNSYQPPQQAGFKPTRSGYQLPQPSGFQQPLPSDVQPQQPSDVQPQPSVDQPQNGGYQPPQPSVDQPQNGGYQPPQPSVDQPQPQNGGYQPPQQNGGYQPPQQNGGYQPPQQGGIQAPQQSTPSQTKSWSYARVSSVYFGVPIIWQPGFLVGYNPCSGGAPWISGGFSITIYRRSFLVPFSDNYGFSYTPSYATSLPRYFYNY